MLFILDGNSEIGAHVMLFDLFMSFDENDANADFVVKILIVFHKMQL